MSRSTNERGWENNAVKGLDYITELFEDMVIGVKHGKKGARAFSKRKYSDYYREMKKSFDKYGIPKSDIGQETALKIKQMKNSKCWKDYLEHANKFKKFDKSKTASRFYVFQPKSNANHNPHESYHDRPRPPTLPSLVNPNAPEALPPPDCLPTYFHINKNKPNGTTNKRNTNKKHRIKHRTNINASKMSKPKPQPLQPKMKFEPYSDSVQTSHNSSPHHKPINAQKSKKKRKRKEIFENSDRIIRMKKITFVLENSVSLKPYYVKRLKDAQLDALYQAMLKGHISSRRTNTNNQSNAQCLLYDMIQDMNIGSVTLFDAMQKSGAMEKLIAGGYEKVVNDFFGPPKKKRKYK